MTNQSIRIPEGWATGPVHGRYEETRFTFRYAKTDEINLIVQLIGAPSNQYEAEYNLHVAIDEPTGTSDRTDQRAATFYSEAAAMQGTQHLMEQLTRAVENGELQLAADPVADLEEFLAEFSPPSESGWLASLRQRVC